MPFMVRYVLLRPLRPELKLNAREKTLGAGEKFEDFGTHFFLNGV
jgi:hypothetical protein